MNVDVLIFEELMLDDVTFVETRLPMVVNNRFAFVVFKKSA